MQRSYRQDTVGLIDFKKRQAKHRNGLNDQSHGPSATPRLQPGHAFGSQGQNGKLSDMYFASRLQAGRMLASQLLPKYRHEQTAVVALSDGGAVVGFQIAIALRCVLSLLLTKEITLPRELEAIAGISQDGAVSYNTTFSPGELDELIGEYYQFIEQEKLTSMHDLNRMLSPGETVDKRLLKGRNIILVSDGLSSGFAVDLAASFLKPVSIKKMIVATPLASIQAVDRLHVLADEIYCLSVVENYISTDHYYDQRDIPSHDKIIENIEYITQNWNDKQRSKEAGT